ncbi:MAG TPA: ABC transporter ATP-binding protein [Ramlibacter sp.]|jgi:branched-chain amino acid transport system ATP-binding protein
MAPDRLACRNLQLAFGGLHVTRDISLRLPAGARTALIGPNGAGKTTLVNLLSGALKASSGTVLLEGRDVTAESVPTRTRAGLVRTFQVSRLFREATVRDNLRTAVLHRLGLSSRIWLPASVQEQVEAEVLQALASLGIERMAPRITGEMAVGEQRLVEIALALAMKPRVLLLDEPAAGVPESESGRILEAIEALPSDLAVLLIEHDMDLVFRFARNILVLVQGALFAEGTPQEVAANDAVKQIYFGRGAHARAH